MYKNTFYYFLGNKKYHEIYILLSKTREKFPAYKDIGSPMYKIENWKSFGRKLSLWVAVVGNCSEKGLAG